MIKLFLLTLVLTALSFSAYAIPEQDYLKNFHSTVWPFYKQRGESGSFKSANGGTVSYRIFAAPNEKGAIVLVLGQGQAAIMSAELVYDLHAAGYSIYVLDHVGQGLSSREITDTAVSYIEDFDYYVRDLRTFVKTRFNSVEHPKRLMMTNSMGGAVAALYLSRWPKDFDRVVMAVPMFEMNTHGVPQSLSLAVAGSASLAGQGEKLALKEKKFDFNWDADCNESSDGRKLRGCAMMDVRREIPEAAVGGVTWRWLYEALKATYRIRDGLGTKITTPVLILQAGNDERVKNEGQNKVCEQMLNCSIQAFPGSSHRLTTESDVLRDAAMEATLNFFAR
jgi:lysophospholipase